MTIEEKAKAYDKAIERAKSLIGDTIIEESGQHIAEVIFPELKESKDEKIRKTMIALFKGQIPFTSKEDNEKFVAWLEKQGEQKHAWSEEDERTIKEIDEIIYECPYCESKEEISNWLKALKQRIGG